MNKIYIYLKFNIYEKYIWYHWMNRSYKYIWWNHFQNWFKFTVLRFRFGDGISRKEVLQ